MQPISNLIPGAAQLSAAAGVKEPLKIQQTEGEAQKRPRKPMMDEYIPEEKQRPSGLYWIGTDEKGQSKSTLMTRNGQKMAPKCRRSFPVLTAPSRTKMWMVPAGTALAASAKAVRAVPIRSIAKLKD